MKGGRAATSPLPGSGMAHPAALHYTTPEKLLCHSGALLRRKPTDVQMQRALSSLPSISPHLRTGSNFHTACQAVSVLTVAVASSWLPGKHSGRLCPTIDRKLEWHPTQCWPPSNLTIQPTQRQRLPSDRWLDRGLRSYTGLWRWGLEQGQQRLDLRF